ncbi:hypothetical protein BpHYR1_050503 [Brachionus plicatilis]|uniref:Uncharacterized protein n=1 Tax=Brachionus plicatilis TaxID=10195 RepID=A0A3M7S8W7_BRAPC|nr:hypothetical protein BpHYR1_050503 [Brachionus plicatilis]
MIRSVKTIFLAYLVGLVVTDELEWDLVPPAENGTQCIFKSKNKMLICRGSIGVVECSATISLPVGFDVFGLSSQSIEHGSIESKKYDLYPRILNETVYQDKILKGKNISLSHIESNDVGLRVPDDKCWARLVELFNATSGSQNAQIEQSENRVSLFGEILIIGRQVNKRWLGLWRWSLALRFGLGFGWGFGWGIPPYAFLG